MTDIEQEIRRRAVDRSGVLLLTQQDAFVVIVCARQLGRRVLGVDGFFLTPTTTQPSLDHSIDLSSREYAEADCWAAAQEFLRQQKDSGLHFEVVLE